MLRLKNSVGDHRRNRVGIEASLYYARERCRHTVVAHFVQKQAHRMATDKEENSGWVCLELHCSGRQLETAKITFSPNGVIYRVTCGPLSDAELPRLERAALTGDLVRLVFPQRSAVMLADITLEYPQPGWAQIEGRVVGAPLLQQDAPEPSAALEPNPRAPTRTP